MTKCWLSKSAVTVAALSLSAGLACAQPGGTVIMPLQTAPSVLQQAKLMGPHARTSTINLTFSLKLNNTANLMNFIKDANNPQSPLYHKWMTPAQTAAKFGATPAQIAAVEQFLGAHGIKVLDVTPNHILIHTQGATGAYEQALGITINNYTLNGRTFFSTTERPKLPASIAGTVENVIGLNNAILMHPMHQQVKSLGQVKPHGVVPHYPAPPAATSGYYNPFQIATAYDAPDITDANNGAGVTVAILTADTENYSANTDYPAFWSGFHLPGHTVNVIPVDGNSSANDGLVETLLDTEWSGAWAPGATLNVYIAQNPQFTTFTDMYSKFQTDNTAQSMTTSWGAPEDDNTTESTDEAIFALAAAQGISMFAAAGDNGSGDNGGGNNNCDYPSASLYVSAASGTELHANKNGNRISEVASSDTGGAICTLAEPSWQTGEGVPQNGKRNTGDLALNFGAIWPYLLAYNGAWYTVGGTSAVAPQLGGMFADAVSMNGGTSLGQSNELIYNTVNAGNYASDFFDVTSGSNGAYSAGPGWDHPTGWGTPVAQNLIQDMIGGSTSCPQGYSEFDGSIAAHQLKQITSYSAGAGQENAILTGPAGIQLGVRTGGKTYGIPGNEIHRNAPAGTYTWGAKAGSSAGNYMFCSKHP
ncbi:MAG: S53 family peptidase [Gammaproteobacteria bacterium]